MINSFKDSDVSFAADLAKVRVIFFLKYRLEASQISP